MRKSKEGKTVPPGSTLVPYPVADSIERSKRLGERAAGMTDLVLHVILLPYRATSAGVEESALTKFIMLKEF